MPREDHVKGGGGMCVVIEDRSWQKLMSCFEAHHLFFSPLLHADCFAHHSLLWVCVTTPPTIQAQPWIVGKFADHGPRVRLGRCKLGKG